MELHELEVLQWQTGTGDHGVAVSRAGVRAGAAEVRASVTARREHGLVRAEPMKGAVFRAERDDTDTLAVLHDQVQGEVLDEEVGVVTEGLAVEGVEKGMTGTVSGSSATVCLATLAKLQGLTTEGALVDLAFLGTRERNTVVLKLAGFRRVI